MWSGRAHIGNALDRSASQTVEDFGVRGGECGSHEYLVQVCSRTRRTAFDCGNRWRALTKSRSDRATTDACLLYAEPSTTDAERPRSGFRKPKGVPHVNQHVGCIRGPSVQLPDDCCESRSGSLIETNTGQQRRGGLEWVCRSFYSPTISTKPIEPRQCTVEDNERCTAAVQYSNIRLS